MIGSGIESATFSGFIDCFGHLVVQTCSIVEPIVIGSEGENPLKTSETVVFRVISGPIF